MMCDIVNSGIYPEWHHKYR